MLNLVSVIFPLFHYKATPAIDSSTNVQLFLIRKHCKMEY